MIKLLDTARMNLFPIMFALIVAVVAVQGKVCRIYYRDLPYPSILNNSITSLSLVTQKLGRNLALEVAVKPITLEEQTTLQVQALEISFADLDSLIALIAPEKIVKEAVILNPVDEKLYYLNAVQLNNSIDARIRRNNLFWWLFVLLMGAFGVLVLYFGVQWVSVKYFDADLISHSTNWMGRKEANLLPSGNREGPLEKKVFWEAFGAWACVALVLCFI